MYTHTQTYTPTYTHTYKHEYSTMTIDIHVPVYTHTHIVQKEHKKFTIPEHGVWEG